MYITVKLDGLTYRSEERDDIKAEDAAEQMYQLMGRGDEGSSSVLKLFLDSGCILVLGPAAVNRAHIIYEN